MSEERQKRNEYVNRWRKTPSGKESVRRYREKSSEQRKEWARQYYLRRKEHIINRTKRYRKDNPGKTIERNRRDRNNGKNKERGIKARAELKSHYLKAQAIKYGFTKQMIEQNPIILEIIKYSIKIKRYGNSESK